jgi:glycosyltransferase involved in cell wall biosynthesis
LSLLWHGAGIAALARRSRCQHLHAHFAHTSAAHAVVGARLAGISVSFVGHGFDVYSAQAEISSKLRHADFAVAVCGHMLDFFRSQYAPGKYKLIPCGIDTSRFRQQEVNPQRDRLLFVGRLVEKKGVDTLLRALALVPDDVRPQLDIVGDGPLRLSLLRACRELGLTTQVRFLGARSNAWLVRHGGNYTALVAPFQLASNGDRDTGPVVAKEAMALGLPVVASNFMGLAEIVDDGRTGFLFPPGDSPALARALLRLNHMTAPQRARMGQRGRRRVEECFDAQLSASSLSQLVEAA